MFPEGLRLDSREGSGSFQVTRTASRFPDGGYGEGEGGGEKRDLGGLVRRGGGRKGGGGGYWEGVRGKEKRGRGEGEKGGRGTEERD